MNLKTKIHFYYGFECKKYKNGKTRSFTLLLMFLGNVKETIILQIATN